jgi:hypothetical protein
VCELPVHLGRATRHRRGGARGGEGGVRGRGAREEGGEKYYFPIFRGRAKRR